MTKEDFWEVGKKSGEIIGEGTRKTLTVKDVENQQRRIQATKDKTEFENFIKGLGSFSFLFYDYLKNINIPMEIKTRFIFLTTYIKYNSGGILIDTDKQKYQPSLTRDTLREKLQLQENAFINTIKILKENNLIYEQFDSYFINEKIIVKGKLTKSQKNEPFTRLFSDSIKELYKESTTRQHGQLYYFFAILPFVNFKYNYVCYNREETDLTSIKFMDIKDICGYVGYKTKDWKKFWNNLRYFKIHNQNVISTKIVDKCMLIAVNPNLYYAGNESCLDELKILLMEFYNESIQNMIS